MKLLLIAKRSAYFFEENFPVLFLLSLILFSAQADILFADDKIPARRDHIAAYRYLSLSSSGYIDRRLSARINFLLALLPSQCAIGGHIQQGDENRQRNAGIVLVPVHNPAHHQQREKMNQLARVRTGRSAPEGPDQREEKQQPEARQNQRVPQRLNPDAHLVHCPFLLVFCAGRFLPHPPIILQTRQSFKKNAAATCCGLPAFLAQELCNVQKQLLHVQNELSDEQMLCSDV